MNRRNDDDDLVGFPFVFATFVFRIRTNGAHAAHAKRNYFSRLRPSILFSTVICFVQFDGILIRQCHVNATSCA